MATLQRFTGKTVLVTGAASGIGQATVVRLVAEGATAIGVDTNEEGLRQTVARATVTAGEGGSARYLVGSVSDESTAPRVVADVLATEGKLDVLVNLAGILRSEPVISTTLELFRQVLEVNLVGTFLFCREAVPALLATKGNIVNAASTSSLYGHPYMTAYAASKGGVYALTHSLAWELLTRGVRVNAVAPGGIATPMTKEQGERMGGLDLSLFAHLSRPDRAFAGPESVAGVIAMLASEDGAHMTGEVVKMDGGVHN